MENEYTLAVWECPKCCEYVVYGGREVSERVEVFAGAIKQHME